jgi:hypothetical protein
MLSDEEHTNHTEAKEAKKVYKKSKSFRTQADSLLKQL